MLRCSKVFGLVDVGLQTKSSLEFPSVGAWTVSGWLAVGCSPLQAQRGATVPVVQCAGGNTTQGEPRAVLVPLVSC